VTKKQMVRRIATQLGVDQAITKNVVQLFLDSILEVVQDEGRLELRNFGVFEIKHRAARKARNPRTNEEIHVPAKRVITFQAGKNVARRLGHNAPPPRPAAE